MGDPQLRYELKMPLRRPEGVERAVGAHGLGFFEEHPERQINSIYFDSPNFDCLTQSEEGAQRRVKMRLRWYGVSDDPQGQARLELKWRDAGLGWKEVSPAPWSGSLAGVDPRALLAALRDVVPEHRRPVFDALPTPTLVVRYRRRYYRSRDGDVRLTLDDRLGFRGQAGLLRLTLAQTTELRRFTVVELKVAADKRPSLRRALQGFSYRPERCSKYALGLNLFLGRAP